MTTFIVHIYLAFPGSRTEKFYFGNPVRTAQGGTKVTATHPDRARRFATLRGARRAALNALANIAFCSEVEYGVAAEPLPSLLTFPGAN